MLRILSLFLLCLPLNASAQGRPFGLQTEAGVAALDEARALMFAFRLNEGAAAFERLAQQEPTSPAAAFHLAQLRLWQALATEEDAHYDLFHRSYDALTEQLKRMEDGPWRTHLLAEAHFLRAIALVKGNDYLKAAWEAKKANDYYFDNVRAHPRFEESYKGVGLTKVLIGSIPKSYGWILKIFGFSGSVQEGLDDLTRAAERSRYGKYEAAFILASLDLLMNTGERGELRRLAEIQRALPPSPFVNYLTATLLLSDRQADRATRLLESSLQYARDSRYQFVNAIHYKLGEAYLYRNEFAKAERQFRTYLQKHDGPALRSVAHLEIGQALEMQGKREEAVSWYKKVRAYRKDYDDEQFAVRQAKRWLASPMTAADKALLLGTNAYSGGRYDEAVSKLRPLVEDTSLPEVLRAEAAHRIGRALQEAARYEDARRYYQWAVSNPGPADTRWGPWSQYYLGETYEELGQPANARTAYEAALNWSGDYDYRKGLEQRAKAALDRLRRAG